jgi:hypothetical protein
MKAQNQIAVVALGQKIACNPVNGYWWFFSGFMPGG